ncbi:mannosyltransferase putative-domain-containing protein [Scheffersomyces coipomensis]|uniref:mannosyltransferase putative-domain-containing protein n=1 Tax=Scheffersomyces coipomensis TaxID=1788519 RepID=UPI00315DDCCE
MFRFGRSPSISKRPIFTTRYFSSFPLLICIVIIIILVINLFITKLDNQKSLGYHVIGNKDYKKEIDKMESMEYTQRLLSEIKSTKEEELIKSLKEDLETKHKDQLLVDIKTELNKKYKNKLLSSLKQQMNEQFTQEFTDQAEFTYSIFESLQKKFYRENYKTLKEFTVLTLFKDLNLPEIELPENFNAKLNEKMSSMLNKNSFYKYLIQDVLLKNIKFDDLEAFKKSTSSTLKPQLINSGESYTKQDLNVVKISDKNLVAFKTSFEKVLKSIKRLANPPLQFINDSGIVIFFDDYDSNTLNQKVSMLLLQILQLKNLGSSLPIEIIFTKNYSFLKPLISFFNIHFKTSISTIVIDEIINLKDLELPTNFPHKLLSLLVSSFNNIIFLDIGVVPIKNVDALLYSEPYFSHKFLIWPHEKYQRQISPIFWEDLLEIIPGEQIRRDGITNKQQSLNDQDESSYYDLSNLPDQLSTDSSFMVFSKQEHFKSLLLSIYFNLLGNDVVYPLLYQGISGGDRETFIPALHVLNERYYQVKQESLILHKFDSEELPMANLQTDPRDVINYMKSWKHFLIHKAKLDTRLNPFEQSEFTEKLIEEFHEYKKKLIGEEFEDSDGEKKTFYAETQFPKPSVLTFNFRSNYQPLLTEEPKKLSRVIQVPDAELRARLLGGVGGAGGKTLITSTSGSKIDYELRFQFLLTWLYCESKLSTITAFWNDESINLSQESICKHHSSLVEFLKEDTKDLDYNILNFLKKDYDKVGGFNDNEETIDKVIGDLEEEAEMKKEVVGKGIKAEFDINEKSIPKKKVANANANANKLVKNEAEFIAAPANPLIKNNP